MYKGNEFSEFVVASLTVFGTSSSGVSACSNGVLTKNNKKLAFGSLLKQKKNSNSHWNFSFPACRLAPMGSLPEQQKTVIGVLTKTKQNKTVIGISHFRRIGWRLWGPSLVLLSAMMISWCMTSSARRISV
jgi:hypothetical protein